MSRLTLALLTLALSLSFTATSARAQAGTGHLEIYAGLYSPESDLLDDETTFGLRAGYQFNDRWGYLFQAGRYSTSEVFPVLTDDGEQIDLDLWVLDFSVAWYLSQGNHEGLTVFFGPGFAFTDLEAGPFEDGLDFAGDDSFTVHAGLGWNFMAGEQLVIRPDVRARYFDSSDSIDLEATVAVGWVFE